MDELTAWSSFYVMTGSSAAALTGLMFVVISIVMASERVSQSPDGVATFSTPTVMHFAAALLVSAILVAPWHSRAGAGIAAGIVGLSGVAYLLRIALLTRRLDSYKADVEDWAWYTILPTLTYGTILGGAIALYGNVPAAMFAIAAAVVLLIFIGIRNAWDVVTFIALKR